VFAYPTERIGSLEEDEGAASVEELDAGSLDEEEDATSAGWIANQHSTVTLTRGKHVTRSSSSAANYSVRDSTSSFSRKFTLQQDIFTS
jgi:hypothetical protein